jgi:hypothetical protein
LLLQEHVVEQEQTRLPTPFSDIINVEILTIPCGSTSVRVTSSFEPPITLIQKGDVSLEPHDVLMSIVVILVLLILVNLFSSPNRAQENDEEVVPRTGEIVYIS